ncbi:hypothetical protein [Pseudomonas sp. LW8]|uniref:hypothetical protein n=1 Tax=Pseudomonas sp. LW8 TaxID=3242677 RepID=UPI0035C11EB6
MASENTVDRKQFEAFSEDRRFGALRGYRQNLGEEMRTLRSRVFAFRDAERTLTVASAQELRELVLRMLQLQHAMSGICEAIPSEYSAVKERILADFATDEPVAYLQKMNEWLRVIESLKA